MNHLFQKKLNFTIFNQDLKVKIIIIKGLTKWILMHKILMIQQLN